MAVFTCAALLSVSLTRSTWACKAINQLVLWRKGWVQPTNRQFDQARNREISTEIHPIVLFGDPLTRM